MKVNHYAVLPAAVRYDAALTDKSKLLFAEISAATNTYGVCEEDNGYFAAAIKADTRTVTRCISQLVDSGHVSRIKEFGKRKLKINQKLIPQPAVEEIDETDIPEEDNDFCFNLLAAWEKGLGCALEKKEMYFPMIRARLIQFKKEELLSSVKNRIDYVTKTSEWHLLPENKQYQIDITILLRDDDSVFKYLNMKAEETGPKLRAFGD